MNQEEKHLKQDIFDEDVEEEFLGNFSGLKSEFSKNHNRKQEEE